MLIKYYDSMLKAPEFFNPFHLIDDLTTTSTRSSNYRTEVTDRGLNLSIDLPGVKATDLTVQTTGRDVKVTGRLRGSQFDYAYRLSRDYNPETVEATLECGVLTLHFDRIKKDSPRTIEVKVT